MSSYLSSLKQIFANVALLFRHFLHWNISKVIIFLYENIVGLLLSLPFAGILVYQYFTTYEGIGASASPEAFLLDHIGALILSLVIFVFIVAIFITTYTYGSLLLQNLHKSYLEGKALPYKKNLYFSWSYFSSYMGILGRVSLYVLAPISACILLLVGCAFAVTTNQAATKMIALISFVLFLAILVWLLVLLLRLVFSWYGLLYSEKIESSRFYIAESFRLTKERVWKIIAILTPFLLALGIIGSIFQAGQDFLVERKMYEVLKIEQQATLKDDHSVLEAHFIGSDDDKVEFGKLEKRYPPNTTDIDRNFLSEARPFVAENSMSSLIPVYKTLFVVISFLLLEGISSMIYLSIYQIVKKEDNTDAPLLEV